jgi:hypothetical protein
MCSGGVRFMLVLAFSLGLSLEDLTMLREGKTFHWQLVQTMLWWHDVCVNLY